MNFLNEIVEFFEVGNHSPAPIFLWPEEDIVEKSPPLWGRDNEGGKASDWSRIQNPAF